jgi:hypothetical protein
MSMQTSPKHLKLFKLLRHVAIQGRKRDQCFLDTRFGYARRFLFSGVRRLKKPLLI